MVERTRSLWKRQTILNRDKSALPAYDVMHDEPSGHQDAPQPTVRTPQQQISKLIVHAPSDPGMLSYISQPARDTSTNADQDQHHKIAAAPAPVVRHGRTGTWSQPASQQGTAWHGRSGSAGFPSESGSQAAESELHTAFSWPPPVLHPPVTTQAPQQQHEAANLISWDDSVCVQSPPTPTASAMKDCSQAVFVQQQRTDQCQQGTGLTEPQQQVLQLPEESNKQSGADTCLASRQDGYSSSSTASDSYDAALALIPKRDLFATITAAPKLPERLPAFTLGRPSLVPEQSFEQSAVW